MAIPNKKSIYQDGIILWLAYHLFDVLRQVSVFQQIRNISKWVWNYQFKKKNPNASKEEHDKAWREHRPFTSGFLFPELWVIGNILLAIVGCLIVAKTSCKVIFYTAYNHHLTQRPNMLLNLDRNWQTLLPALS